MPTDIRSFFSTKKGGSAGKGGGAKKEEKLAKKEDIPAKKEDKPAKKQEVNKKKVAPVDNRNKKTTEKVVPKSKRKQLVIEDSDDDDDIEIIDVPSDDNDKDDNKNTTKSKKRKSEERVEVSASAFFADGAAAKARKLRSSPRNAVAMKREDNNDDDDDDIEVMEVGPPSPQKKRRASALEDTKEESKPTRTSPRKKKSPPKMKEEEEEEEPEPKAQTPAKPSSARKIPPSTRTSSTKKVQREAPLKPSLEMDSFDMDSAAPQILHQYTFVFTGVLPGISREEAQEMVKILGGRVTGSVSGKTDYLVFGEELEDGREYTEGSKYKRAVKEGTHLVRGEKALFGLMKQYNDKAALAEGKKPVNKVKAEASPAPAAVAPASAGKPMNPYAKPTNPYAKKTTVGNPYAKPSNPYAKKAPTSNVSKSNSQPDQKPAAKSKDNDLNQLWVDKHKPSHSTEILGNQDAVRKLSLWLSTWEQRFNNPQAVGKAFSAPNGPWKAALLSGPPGIGKTTTATLVAYESGRDVLEFNASDVRSKKAMQEELGDITGSQTLEFIAKNRSGKKNSRTKRCIIMDEVDGMGAGDRSGMSELIQMIKRSRVPIICICNDRQNQKMKSLVPYCMDLRYRRPVKSVIATRAVEVARQEGLTVEKNAAEAIVESCGNDVRQVLNCMQMWASNNKATSTMTYKDLKERERSINKDEILRVSLFDAAKTIVEGRKGLTGSDPKAERDHFFKRTDAFFVDYSFVGLIVQQNYLKVMQPQFNDVKRQNDQTKIIDVLDRMADAAETLSDYAQAENQLRQGQNWSLLPFISSLAVKTGYHAGGERGGFLPGFPEFTTWLGRNSTYGKKIRILNELGHHMNFSVSGGTAEIRQSYLPVLRERFLGLLSKGAETNVEAAIELMDQYGLDRDDVFEKLDEFKMDPKASDFSNLDSKMKAAFTRVYNQGVHKSQALVAEQGAGGKKPKRQGSAVGESVDPDAIDDDKFAEDEDEEEDEDDEEKIKAMFKKKGRKAAAGKTGGKAKKSKKK